MSHNLAVKDLLRCLFAAVSAIFLLGLAGMGLSFHARSAAPPFSFIRATSPAGRLSSSSARAARSFQRHLDTIQANAASPGRHAPIILTAVEANAWFADGGSHVLPVGISHLLLSCEPDWISGSSSVDFSRLRRAHLSGNSIASVLFSGVHQIFVRARVVSTASPAAVLRIESFSLDRQTIPNPLLDLAMAEFVQPRHPEIKRQFQVPLPRGVHRIQVGNNRVTLIY